jgi:NAD(P) transhydrogenase subunit alpha
LSISVGVIKEISPGERRVAMAPRVMDMLAKVGAQFIVERGAGIEAGFTDSEYEAKGARMASTADEVRQAAEVLLAVRVEDSPSLKPGQIVVGMCDPLSEPKFIAQIAGRGITLFSMELIPRITRAQSMDVLSSMATVAGYKAVLLAAVDQPRMFPLMMTAAGTIPAARVLVIGAGVAGLQAISTARRLGAVVSGYDVRAAVKEQIESLGAKFVVIDAGESGEGTGGYAKQLSEEAINRQREALGDVMKEMDVVVTTAAVPGRKAPLLITASMARKMAPGSVIVDLAAERGGNCELTKPGEKVVDNGVTILGPLNLPASIPNNASLMYARNLSTFLKNMINKEGQINIDLSDEITKETMVARDGKVANPRVEALLGTAVTS